MSDKISTLLDLKPSIEAYVSILLLRLGAVKTTKDGEEPFTYTSGNRGPIYVNNRVLISHVGQMNVITGFLFTLISAYARKVDYVAGGATAGMPFAQDIAKLLGVPYFYVRKGDRKHGVKGRVVGDLSLLKGNGILIEDLITDGGSKEDFITSLREAGSECNACFVVFDREQGGWKRLNEMKVELHSLTTMRKTLEIAVDKRIIDKPTYDGIREYLDHPKVWSEKRGYDFK